tara:strand:- start:346 stop:879 length:534 start_codon:yes stop_codon:yes gene_type:complete
MTMRGVQRPPRPKNKKKTVAVSKILLAPAPLGPPRKKRVTSPGELRARTGKTVLSNRKGEPKFDRAKAKPRKMANGGDMRPLKPFAPRQIGPTRPKPKIDNLPGPFTPRPTGRPKMIERFGKKKNTPVAARGKTTKRGKIKKVIKSILQGGKVTPKVSLKTKAKQFGAAAKKKLKKG